jgi:hypothetical protein
MTLTSPGLTTVQIAADANSAPQMTSDHFLEQARSAKREKRRRDYQAACEAWLLAEHGVLVGDSVKVQYTDEAREVLIETFELHWPIGRDLAQPTLVFEGPTVMKGPRRVEQASNWCTRATIVTKRERPSAWLRSGLGKLSEMASAYSRMIAAR